MSYKNPYEQPEQPDYFVPVEDFNPDSAESQSSGAATPQEALDAATDPAPQEPRPAPPPSIPSQLPNQANVPTLVSGVVPDSVVAQNQEKANNILALQLNKAAISKQYDDIISQLRDQYQFAETPEEKARLKYMLADIELEFDAANQSIEEVYELRQQNVRDMGPDILSRSQAEGQRAGSYFTSLADTMSQGAANVQNRSADEFTGLGLENVEQVENEWVSLIRSFAPVQQTYIEDQGRQTINDLARIEASMEMQGASQIAQLERMRAGTVNTAQYRHMQQVEQRIESEKQDARARITSIMLDKLARLQSAAEFNAGLVLRADEMIANANNPDEYYGGLVNYAFGMGESGPTDPAVFLEGFITRSGGVQPDSYIWNVWLTNATRSQQRNVDTSLNHLRSLRQELFNVIDRSASLNLAGQREYRDELQALIREAESAYAQDRANLDTLNDLLAASNETFED